MSRYTLKWENQGSEYTVHYGYNEDLGYYLLIPELRGGLAIPATLVSSQLTSISNQEYLNTIVSMDAPEEHIHAVEKGLPF